MAQHAYFYRCLKILWSFNLIGLVLYKTKLIFPPRSLVREHTEFTNFSLRSNHGPHLVSGVGHVGLSPLLRALCWVHLIELHVEQVEHKAIKCRAQAVAQAPDACYHPLDHTWRGQTHTGCVIHLSYLSCSVG